jgi:hypothetical protein
LGVGSFAVCSILFLIDSITMRVDHVMAQQRRQQKMDSHHRPQYLVALPVQR